MMSPGAQLCAHRDHSQINEGLRYLLFLASNGQEPQRRVRRPSSNRLLYIYHKFVCDFIGPRVLAAMPETRRLVFQQFPPLRISPPSTSALGKKHTDSDYKHQAGTPETQSMESCCVMFSQNSRLTQPAPTNIAGQINYWLPFVPCEGANSLYAESSPGNGDFSAFKACNGEAVRFYGNRCMHYTVPNTTDTTR